MLTTLNEAIERAEQREAAGYDTKGCIVSISNSTDTIMGVRGISATAHPVAGRLYVDFDLAGARKLRGLVAAWLGKEA
jgi:hypothetical protein